MFTTNDMCEAIDHMNHDHADANVLYVRAFGGIDNIVSASLQTINPDGMTLSAVDSNGTDHKDIFIAFEPTITNPEQVHGKLISMVRKARKLLGEEK